MQNEMKDNFEKNGYVFPVEVFSVEESAGLLKRYRDYVQRYGSGKGDERKVRGNKIFRTHILATWAKEIVTHPKLLGAVSAVLGSTNLLIWSSDLTVKPKQSSECFGWHQDEAYADLGPPPKLCTAWLALTHASPTNGCVRFLRGSHMAGQLPHSSFPRTAENNLVLGQVVPDASLPTCQEVDCTLLPGQASLHGWRTVHSSQPNTSEEDRVGIAIRFMSADVRQSQPVVKDRVSLALGEYHGDWFELETWPVNNYGKEEWAEHKRSMDREWERRKKSKELHLLPSHKERREGEP